MDTELWLGACTPAALAHRPGMPVPSKAVPLQQQEPEATAEHEQLVGP